MNYYEKRPRKNKVIEAREFQTYVKRRNCYLLFSRLLEQYIICRSRVYSPVSCSRADPESKKPLNPFLAVQFATDFEHCVKAALSPLLGSKDSSNPTEREDCFDALEREQMGEDPNPKYSLQLRETVVERVGRLAVSRYLPKYFIRVKK
jgi:hypothetical protein